MDIDGYEWLAFDPDGSGYLLDQREVHKHKRLTEGGCTMENIRDYLAIITVLVSVVTVAMTLRRDGRTARKERDEQRDTLLDIKHSVNSLVKANEGTERAIIRFDERLNDHEKRIWVLEKSRDTDDERRKNHE